MLATAALLPATVCGVAFTVNFVAIYYTATRAIPFTTMLVIVAIWLFVILPLTLVGAVLGRNMAGAADHPCRVNPVPRPLPVKKWFMEPSVIVLLGGILPFGSIFIEMYFIFTSFWAYKVYYVYGFMLLVFVILIIVTVCVSIVCTYFLLNSEVWSLLVFFVVLVIDYFPVVAGLPVAMDQFFVGRLNGHLRVPLCHLLLFLQNTNVRRLPNELLLWLHGPLGGHSWRHVW
jgi:hypothetical protein